MNSDAAGTATTASGCYRKSNTDGKPASNTESAALWYVAGGTQTRVPDRLFYYSSDVYATDMIVTANTNTIKMNIDFVLAAVY